MWWCISIGPANSRRGCGWPSSGSARWCFTACAGLKPGQVQPLVAGRPARLEAGDMVAVPRPDRYHVVPRLYFGSAPYQAVGRYRLYTIRTPLLLPARWKARNAKLLAEQKGDIMLLLL